MQEIYPLWYAAAVTSMAWAFFTGFLNDKYSETITQMAQ